MPRVLGGENAVVPPYQFFLAASTPTRHDFGSATLITDHHAITSGKLIAGYKIQNIFLAISISQSFYVFLKSYQKWILAYGSAKLGPQSKKLESRIAFLHPAYDVATNENDLGIILLPTIPTTGMFSFT